MYKYLLCWRYLRTRYIALASIVSVMLGVATMIVVNAVMAGFADKMRDRLHGVLADVVVESASFNGFHNPDEVMALIRDVAGKDVEAMAAAVETYGLLTMFVGEETVPRQVLVIGIKPEDRAKTGEFAEFVMDETGKEITPTFAVDPGLWRNTPEGMQLRRMRREDDPVWYDLLMQQARAKVPSQGAIVGYALATQHMPGKGDMFLSPRGAQVNLSFATTTRPPRAVSDSFAVTGFFKSGMSEYDSTHVYVPLERLQYLRGQGEGEAAAVNQIQIKCKPGADLDRVARTIETALMKKWGWRFSVLTWEQKQGPLLAAVAVEQSILNILLFFIIAVAGFGILAIFSMIVVEKTRDIGILKALGASTAGVRQIFLAYGLSLGMVGSGVGMAGGLLFVRYINVIEELLSKATGRKVFDDNIYYFNEIPTLIDPFTVAWIVGGALLIAVAASVWPAQRASRLHPVQALRFE